MSRYVDHYQGPRKQDRRTPRDFFDKQNVRFRFTMDGACTQRNALLPYYSTAKRPRSWEGQRVFCNPPWSDIPPFIELAKTAEFACLLVPARVNARWFHRALDLGAIPDFWKGKLKFSGKWNSPTDCLLLLFGADRPAQSGSDDTEILPCGCKVNRGWRCPVHGQP